MLLDTVAQKKLFETVAGQLKLFFPATEKRPKFCDNEGGVLTKLFDIDEMVKRVVWCRSLHQTDSCIFKIKCTLNIKTLIKKNKQAIDLVDKF